MRELIKGRVSPYYCTETEMLFLGDTFSVLKKIAPSSVDMVIADPPYFLSNDGVTCHAGQMVSVNKGDWDKVSSVSEKHFSFDTLFVKVTVTPDSALSEFLSFTTPETIHSPSS